MLKYYCQADGGQWNVPVYVEDYLPRECGENVVIHGATLVSQCSTADGHGLLIVHQDTLHDQPQG